MTARNDADRQLTAWLADAAPTREPEHLLGQVLARTARTRRRSAWRIPERWIPMSAISSRLAPSAPVPWRTLGVAVVLLLALAVGLALMAGAVTQRPAPPFGLAANGVLAYSVDGDIVVVDGPTGTARTVLDGEAEDTLPWFSPDGTKFAFMRGPEQAAELWVATANGSDPRKIAGPFAEAPWIEWAPGGEAIIISDAKGDPRRFTLARTDGTGSSTIDTGLPEADAPMFRPGDGGQVSFRGKDANGDWGFYLINRDGTGRVALSLDAGFQQDDYYSENRDYYFLSQSWHSNGSQFIYHTLEPAPGSPAGPGFRLHVVTLDAAGAVASERILQFDASADDEFDAILVPGTDDVIYRTVDGSRFGLARGSLTVGGPGRPFDVTAGEYIGAVLSPDARQLIVTVPHVEIVVPATEPAPPDVILLDLLSGAKTTLAIPPDPVWQRRGR